MGGDNSFGFQQRLSLLRYCSPPTSNDPVMPSYNQCFDRMKCIFRVFSIITLFPDFKIASYFSKLLESANLLLPRSHLSLFSPLSLSLSNTHTQLHTHPPLIRTSFIYCKPVFLSINVFTLSFLIQTFLFLFHFFYLSLSFFLRVVILASL